MEGGNVLKADPTEQIKDRNGAVAALLDREHFRFRSCVGVEAAADEVKLTSDWCLRPDESTEPWSKQMVSDFQRFCAECFGVGFSDSSDRIVEWRLREPQFPAETFDRADAAVEEFEIAVESDRIEISARHWRGLLHGTHRLEWTMADRGGPLLKLGQSHWRPVFQPRISNGVFVESRQTPGNLGKFTDEYLGLMSHYGVNGIHVSIQLWDLFCSESLPELNCGQFESHILSIRDLARRMGRFGIDLFLQLSTPPLDQAHEVFAIHPEVRGARVEIFVEGISGKPWHNLCSGSELVHRSYAEAIEAIFTHAPELAGAILIIGGESFFHCFTRPADAANGDTNCSNCRGRSASSEVAKVVNTLAAAVKSTGSHRLLFAWPYSAWIWSAKDPFELDWISRLDPEVSVLSNFDGYDEDFQGEGGAYFYDYNIKCIGPSTTFANQRDCCRGQGKEIFAKVETCTTPDAFFVPYLPLHYRWMDRVNAMRNSRVAGFVGQWRFFGMNGSLPEEIQFRGTWEKASDQILRTVCHRDFGLRESETDTALAGWELLSKAWDYFPYSAMTAGERSAYMRGPFYLGTAHPLIFDVQDNYGLPKEFRLLRGDLKEMAKGDELADLERKAKPRYVSDLLITLPFGVDQYLNQLGRCRSVWTRGQEFLESVLEQRGGRAEMELGIVKTLGSHLRSLENVVKFYRARDLLQTSQIKLSDFERGLKDLRTIIDDEIANAETMLPILERDPRIGFGYTYGPVYDARMVRAKIAQCQFVRDIELPRFSKVIRFHVWLDSP